MKSWRLRHVSAGWGWRDGKFWKPGGAKVRIGGRCKAVEVVVCASEVRLKAFQGKQLKEMFR